MAGDRRPSNGRERLLDAAERLMDERGVDGVSMREIGVAAGHRNPSAIQYHFGDRDELVRAVFRRYSDVIDRDRTARLDTLEADRGVIDLRRIIEAFVDPMIARLADSGGRRHWRLAEQLLHHPTYRHDVNLLISVTPSIHRARALVAASAPISHVPLPVRVVRAEQVVGVLVRGLADQARAMDADPPQPAPLSPAAFRANLIDVILGMLVAPSTVALPDIGAHAGSAATGDGVVGPVGAGDLAPRR